MKALQKVKTIAVEPDLRFQHPPRQRVSGRCKRSYSIIHCEKTGTSTMLVASSHKLSRNRKEGAEDA